MVKFIPTSKQLMDFGKIMLLVVFSLLVADMAYLLRVFLINVSFFVMLVFPLILLSAYFSRNAGFFHWKMELEIKI